GDGADQPGSASLCGVCRRRRLGGPQLRRARVAGARAGDEQLFGGVVSWRAESRERPGEAFHPVAHATRLAIHDNSKIHSTSTEIFPGSEPMPTALRAPTPASSPNTSAINSEKPSITLGWSLKSAAALTMPSVLTRRLILFSEPIVLRTVLRMARPTRRAA